MNQSNNLGNRIGALFFALILACSTHAATAPVFSAGPTATPSLAPVNTTVTFTCTLTGATPITIAWDFGDGSTLAANGANTTVMHTYTKIAFYVAKATAVDANGLGTIQTVSVTVTSVPTNVPFQMRTYTTTVIPLSNAVPASVGCDLIFVFVPDVDPTKSKKYLCIPTDPAVRAVFDPNNQRFYRIDSTAGLINGYNTINSTLINTDGTVFGPRTDSPPVTGNGQSSLQSYSIPLSIDPTKRADIAVLDASTLAYRNSETNIYEIARDPTSIVFKTTPIPLVAPNALAIDYDIEDSTQLLVESPVTDKNKVQLPHRISAYLRNGQLFDQIMLTNNALIPNYSGNASGIAWDVENGDIYVLDGIQLIYLKFQRPTLSSVAPNHGPVAGGTVVQINGAFMPPDAIIFFGGNQAAATTFKSSSQLICTTPAHATGTVDVTMTGTGIVPGSPATLVGGYTFGNVPPVAVLTTQSSVGASPFTVVFNIAGTNDIQGTIQSIKIDYGDGTTDTFPNDLSLLTKTHIYSGNAMFTATLTITDTLGPTASASVLITVGKGGSDVVGTLMLKTLTMKVDISPGSTHTKDHLTMTGQVVLPSEISPSNLEGGSLKASVNGVVVDNPNVPLGKNGTLNTSTDKFAVHAVKGRAVPAGTYTFTYSLRNSDLSKVTPMITAGVTRVTIPVSITIVSSLGRQFFFGDGTSDTFGNGNPKIAVVDVKTTSKSSSLSLVRK